MEVFVARQPVFDAKMSVLGYELLFRSGLDNYFDSSIDGDYATRKVVSNSFLVIGLDKVTSGKKAFVNFTRNHLLSSAPFAVPNSKLGVEILESVEPDAAIVDACVNLKKAGYVILLDDFVFSEKYRPLLDFVDIVKIDFSITGGDERREVLNRINNKKIKFLAEKVETDEEFKSALDMGYSYFQGYFFSKPIIVSGVDIAVDKLNYFNILQEVNKDETDFDNMELIVKRDVSLSYKLLKFINSVFFSPKVRIESIKHALIMLGFKEIRRWVNIIVLSSIGQDKAKELITLSLVRAKFCEAIAQDIGLADRDSDFFIMGMFSVLDALIDRPLQDILSELPISQDIILALTGGSNVFSDVFNLAMFYEKGEWNSTEKYVEKLNLEEKKLPEYFYNSIEWAQGAMFA